MALISLKVNGKEHQLDLDPQMPLLWAIRDYIGLTGTKYGCGIGQCGSCIVHMDGRTARSCLITVATAAKAEILTIEGLSDQNNHAVQLAWVEEQVPQCGYCHSGQVMAAAALLDTHPNPTEEEINTSLGGVLCRCGTYPRIKKAIKRAIEIKNQTK
ncbi:MAG: (2Fe-2S)-binding protein [Cyclobacteriaceae bacterium]|nr:(2Fe-2S)-binding protein [Cyclobacteriaceae bacterium]